MPYAKMKARPMPAHLAAQHKPTQSNHESLEALTVPKLEVVRPQGPLAKLKARRAFDRKA